MKITANLKRWQQKTLANSVVDPKWLIPNPTFKFIPDPVLEPGYERQLCPAWIVLIFAKKVSDPDPKSPGTDRIRIRNSAKKHSDYKIEFKRHWDDMVGPEQDISLQWLAKPQSGSRVKLEPIVFKGTVAWNGFLA